MWSVQLEVPGIFTGHGRKQSFLLLLMRAMLRGNQGTHEHSSPQRTDFLEKFNELGLSSILTCRKFKIRLKEGLVFIELISRLGSSVG